jgi:WhiB family redox-sensing transcriptional regulator
VDLIGTETPADLASAFLESLYGEEETWRDYAACRGLDPSLFFPDKGQTGWGNAAKRVCNGDPKQGTLPCPVKAQCLEYAVTNDEHGGIWGGESEKTFRVIRRSRRRAA